MLESESRQTAKVPAPTSSEESKEGHNAQEEKSDSRRQLILRHPGRGEDN